MQLGQIHYSKIIFEANKTGEGKAQTNEQMSKQRPTNTNIKPKTTIKCKQETQGDDRKQMAYRKEIKQGHLSSSIS